MPLLRRSLAISVLVAVPALVAAQPLTFGRTDHVSTAGPRAVVVADFNRDGWPDVAHAGLGSNALAVLLNTLDGSTPAAAVIEGDDGALYAATAFGGTYRQGVVFRIAATVQ
jgi:hypothetical protein